MAGIYIHIPFCKKACHYCDFHFSTSLKQKDELLEALIKEIKLQKDYFSEKSFPLKTIYFGGGTPSLLSATEINSLVKAVKETFPVEANAEITLEANPDDLTKEIITDLKTTEINRLSIGIQSFRDEDLKLMNRAHSSQMAEASVKAVQKAGFHNITIDLIYGIPGLSREDWLINLQKAFALDVPHISAYSLTIEPKTAFAHLIKKGQMKMPDDEISSSHFELMLEEIDKNGYLQYEISNFSRDGWHSRHNSSYWSGAEYLGIGPSSHSYNGKTRQWNKANNSIYIKSLSEGIIPFEREEISVNTAYNEYVLTALRTAKGVDLNKVKDFGEDFLEYCLKENELYLSRKQTVLEGNRIRLTKEGKLFADAIAAQFFKLE
ncbi:MAG: radical SAM family heme chaperone HemW [Bacteroidetes bacterium]|nr:radical SAM family heme chaperone HemW [Bacteroidota bacterium]